MEQHEEDHHGTGDDQDNGDPHDHSCYPSPAGDQASGDRGLTDTILLARTPPF
jgi:hypothetical protein